MAEHKLTPSQEREKKILAVLSEGSEDFGYFAFAYLASQTGIDRRQVRIDTRRLARKGLAQFGKGLWTDGGSLAGSGYAITKAGRTALQQAGEP